MRTRLLAAAVIALVALTGCLPQMNGGGWAWDPSPANPITVDERSGLDLSSVWRWNAAAGTTLFAIGGGANADVVFQLEGPMYRHGNPAEGRVPMWVETETFRAGGYITHCVIHYDPSFAPGSSYWSAMTVAHEFGHCLDYADTDGASGYRGVMSYQNFYDPNWQARYWFGADDRAILARDGYGP